MTHLLTILILALTCATAFAQSVILQGTGADAVHATGAGSVRGVATPAPTSSNYCDGRFTIFNTNQDVVLDNDSGRTWVRDANIDGTKNWTNAIAYCSNLTYATYSDWRLPSLTEFSRGYATNGLVDEAYSANDPALPLGHPFTSVQSASYWTSIQYTAIDAKDGQRDLIDETFALYVWPCRGL